MKTRMIRSLRVILGILALTAVGCGRPEAVPVSVGGFLAVEHPDSARRLLRAMNPERMSRNDRARWSLLVGLADVSAGDTLAGRPILDQGMRYYDRHGSDSERAQAWYTYAKAHIGLGDMEEGIRGYTESAILAEKALASKRLNDSLRKQTEMLLVAVYHTLGLLYFEQGSMPWSPSQRPSRRPARTATPSRRDTAASCWPRRTVPTGITNRP